ncbi:MAG: ABC transporter ATP-binding protein [Rhizobacter sp.]|nr:ABC transporter ATP-binding protein [Ferruginibacter sp.]
MAATYQQKDTILHVQDLSVAYNGKVIIENVNLEEKNVVMNDNAVIGQTIAILGRSGRGKSTFFRALTGLEKPTSGVVLIPDYSQQPVNGQQPAKKVEEGDVGFVNQKYSLFRHKTIYQALHYALRNSVLGSAEKNEKIMHYLSTWGLEKSKDQYPNEISGGQKQRTAILEQLLNSGYYMVLDEPFSGLDVGNILNVRQAFTLVSQSHELNTIIFSTHDIELAVELADSIYVMGYPATPNGLGNAGTLLKHYDLKQMGLAWKNEMCADHHNLVKEIKQLMLSS